MPIKPSKVQIIQTSTLIPTLIPNSFDILIDNEVKDDKKKEEFTSRQILLQKAILVS